MSQFIYDIYDAPSFWRRNKADSVRINKMSKNKNRKRHGRHDPSKQSYKRPRSDNPLVGGRLLNHHETQLENNETVRRLSNQSVGTALDASGFGLVRSTSASEMWSCKRCTFENVGASQCEICGHSHWVEATSRRDVTLMCFVDAHTASQLEHDSWESDLDESLQTALLASLEQSPESKEEETDVDESVQSADDKNNSHFVLPENNQVRRRNLDGNSRRRKSTATPFASYWADSQQDQIFLARCAVINRKRTKREKKKVKDGEKKDKHAFQTFLDEYLPPPTTLLNEFRGAYPYLGNSSIHCVLTTSFLARFNKNSRSVTRVFHGTSSKNDYSIARIGLVPGGTHGIPISHGSAYGRGVYCSPYMSVARSYAHGSMYICLATGCRRNGHIYVAPTERHIIPVYLIRFGNGFSSNSFSTNGALVEFIPPSVAAGSRLNSCDNTRRARHRFSDRQFFRHVRVS